MRPRPEFRARSAPDDAGRIPGFEDPGLIASRGRDRPDGCSQCLRQSYLYGHAGHAYALLHQRGDYQRRAQYLPAPGHPHR